MANLDIQRELQFVSLDTHPANNALVVTYEVLLIVRDASIGQELTRRSKRDQFQLKITAFDQELQLASKLELVSEIAEQILQKCPILTGHRHEILEELQLNLIYLINRKQAQVSTSTNRPTSSVSIRLKSSSSAAASVARSPSYSSHQRQASASSMKARHDHARTSAAANVDAQIDQINVTPVDIYGSYHKKELIIDNDLFLYEQTEEFLLGLDTDTDQAEKHKHVGSGNNDETLAGNFDSYLENLYGEPDERSDAISFIRKLAIDGHKLVKAFDRSENGNLLICALLRTLRDSQQGDPFLGDSILYCLIKLIQYDSEIARIKFFSSESNNSNDLLKICIDSLEIIAKSLCSFAAQNDSRKLTDFYRDKRKSVALFLIVIEKLLKLDKTEIQDDRTGSNSNSNTTGLIQVHGDQLKSIISNFYATLAANEFRSILVKRDNGLQNNCRFILSKLIQLDCRLSIQKGFNNKLRAKKFQPILEHTVSLLDSLQVSHPARAFEEQFTIPQSQLVANELYELEINLLALINNLLCEQRLRARLLRTKNKLLLKCILRNLVCFLASGVLFESYCQSGVLMLPLKSLNILTCCNQVKDEIFKSRIIIKCLLEYLCITNLSLKSQLEAWLSLQSDSIHDKEALQPSNDEIHQIILQPSRADHYIITIWLNLSTCSSLPFYSSENVESVNGNGAARELVQSYLNSSINNVEIFLDNVKHQRPQTRGTIVVLVYLHLKLIRNFTQFLDYSSEPLPWFSSYSGWLNKLNSCIHCLSDPSIIQENMDMWRVPLMVECLAIMNNLVDKIKAFEEIDPELSVGLDKLPDVLFNGILNDFNSLDSENDDLLLVAINFIGTLARRHEICQQFSTKFFENILHLSSFVFSNKSTDTEMTVCLLYSIDRILKHSKYLSEFVTRITNDGSHCNNQQIEDGLEFVEKLSQLILHADTGITSLACSILSRLKHREEQISLNDSIAGVSRFEAYNSKWLHAIRSNRDDGALTSESGRQQSGSSSNSTNLWNTYSNETDEDGFQMQDDELGQLRAVDHDETSDPRVLIKSDEDDDDFDENDEGSSAGGPDLDVIDANSMIKHLAEKMKKPLIYA